MNEESKKQTNAPPSPLFRIIPMADDPSHLGFICDLLTRPATTAALHLNEISAHDYSAFYQEMRQGLTTAAAEEEQNHIVCLGTSPVAWLKLNGFRDDRLWISMLVVHERYRRIGAGTFALRFAEEFAVSTGRKQIYIQTTADNFAALALYRKADYEIIRERNRQYEDGAEWITYTMRKTVLPRENTEENKSCRMIYPTEKREVL